MEILVVGLLELRDEGFCHVDEVTWHKVTGKMLVGRELPGWGN